MNKLDLKRLILRLLIEREAYGYDIIQQLSVKGVKPARNYLYSILLEMERDGLIHGRWVGESPRKKHVFSLTAAGRREFDAAVRRSLDFLMGAYNQNNIEEMPTVLAPIIRFYSGLARTIGIPTSRIRDMNVVMAVGSFDPLVCYPNAFVALSTLSPDGKVFVVKDPEMNFCETRPNMVVLDGWRNDLPLKDGMADLLTLQGFPSGVTEEKTIEECARVLRKDGHLVVEVMKVMIKEKTAPFLRFVEFVAKEYYSHNGKDRVVSLARVKGALSNYFGSVVELDTGDNLVFHATKRTPNKREELYPTARHRASSQITR